MIPKLIKGGKFVDDRGSITFANDFDMSRVKRFYYICHHDTVTVRAWQGHKRESKWFHVFAGKFLVKLIQPDNWEVPSQNSSIASFTLDATDSTVLYIPSGFINGFKALEPNSSMLVFSDVTLDESQRDDFRFEPNSWFDWQKIKK
ncbi:MAG: WxcM-like domain-containing protein [Bacteroidota bacterium]